MDVRLKALSAQFLSDRHHLLAFIAGLVRDPDKAEEILHEVWIKLAETAERGVEIESARGWCRSVAKNLVLLHWKRRGSGLVVDSRIVDLAELAFREQDGAQEYWTAKRRALMSCVQTLPQKSKRLLELRYDRGVSIEELARRRNKSYDSIRKALARVRQAVGHCVAKRLKLAGEVT